jgi:mannose-1-phosphate guanylyltransferase
VKSFQEKPDAKTAKKFVERGNFYWNAGMFFWRASEVLELMREHQPKTATLLAGLPSIESKTFTKKLGEIYPLCENISVDYAVIEKAQDVTGLALDDIGWNDVGSWDAVYELAEKDAFGNASGGDLVAEDSRGNYVDAHKTVALVGVDDLIIVDTPDALLVGHRSKAQDVSKIVKRLDAAKREELL